MSAATGMTRSQLIELASPPCHVCASPVRSVEQSWQPNGDGDWVPRKWFMVCAEGHRVPVEHF